MHLDVFELDHAMSEPCQDLDRSSHAKILRRVDAGAIAGQASRWRPKRSSLRCGGSLGEPYHLSPDAARSRCTPSGLALLTSPAALNLNGRIQRGRSHPLAIAALTSRSQASDDADQPEVVVASSRTVAIPATRSDMPCPLR